MMTTSDLLASYFKLLIGMHLLFSREKTLCHSSGPHFCPGFSDIVQGGALTPDAISSHPEAFAYIRAQQPSARMHFYVGQCPGPCGEGPWACKAPLQAPG